MGTISSFKLLNSNLSTGRFSYGNLLIEFIWTGMFTISFYYTLRVTNERLTEFDIFYSIWFFVAFVIWKHAQLVYLISDDHRFTDLPCSVDTCKRRRNKAHISLSSINVVVVSFSFQRNDAWALFRLISGVGGCVHIFFLCLINQEFMSPSNVG